MDPTIADRAAGGVWSVCGVSVSGGEFHNSGCETCRFPDEIPYGKRRFHNRSCETARPAQPRGSVTVNVVSPGRERTLAVPPWASAIALDQGEAEAGAAGGAGAAGVAAGEPVEGLVDEVGRQARAVVVHLDDRPSPSWARAVTVTVVPGGVWLRALLSRLVITWCSRARRRRR